MRSQFGSLRELPWSQGVRYYGLVTKFATHLSQEDEWNGLSTDADDTRGHFPATPRATLISLQHDNSSEWFPAHSKRGGYLPGSVSLGALSSLARLYPKFRSVQMVLLASDERRQVLGVIIMH